MILNEENIDALSRSNIRSANNTYNLSSSAVPIVNVSDTNINVTDTIGDQINIDYNKECLLRTLCEFTYLPIWYMLNSFAKEEISELVKLNLITIENSTICSFARPTNYLYSIFKLNRKTYSTIPFNMLAHTISKADVYFRAMTGQLKEMDEIVRDLRITGDDIIEPDTLVNIETDSNDVLALLDGDAIVNTNNNHFLVWDESSIKIDKKNISKIMKIDAAISDQIRSKKRVTFDVIDPRGLFIYKRLKINDEYTDTVQYPDLIIPIIRGSKCEARSIGIEMELTCKAYSHYPINLEKYKDCRKYGAVAWFCTDARTKKCLAKAYREIGGLGSVKCYIFDYDVPSNTFEL